MHAPERPCILLAHLIRKAGQPAHEGGGTLGIRQHVGIHKGTCSFFMYGFPKSYRDNINASEKNDLKKLAKILFAMTDEQLDEKVKTGAFQEIKGEE
jgi:hypothetical protein